MMMVVTTPGNTYTVDQNIVSIEKTITNNGLVASGNNMQWTTVSSLTITKANNTGTYTWMANRIKVLLNTNATVYNNISYDAAYTANNPITWSNTNTSGNPNGAIIEINGTGYGTSVDDLNYTASATNVVLNRNCTPFPAKPSFHPLVSGTIIFDPEGKPTRTINYGTGNCLVEFSISIGNASKAVSW